jgi:hypothetical protein
MISGRVLTGLAAAAAVVGTGAAAAPLGAAKAYIVPAATNKGVMAIDLNTVKRTRSGVVATTYLLSPEGKSRALPTGDRFDEHRAQVEFDCGATRLRKLSASVYLDGKLVMSAPDQPDAAWEAPADQSETDALSQICGHETFDPIRVETLAAVRTAYERLLVDGRWPGLD